MGEPPSVGRIRLEKAIQVARVVLMFDPERVETVIDELSAAKSFDGCIPVDIVLERLLMHWLVIYRQEMDAIKVLLHETQKKKDGGNVSLPHFTTVLKKIDPDMSDREALALYNNVANEDSGIEENDFIEAILSHQRDLVMKKQMDQRRDCPALAANPNSHRFNELVESTASKAGSSAAPIHENAIDAAVLLYSRLPIMATKFQCVVRKTAMAVGLLTQMKAQVQQQQSNIKESSHEEDLTPPVVKKSAGIRLKAIPPPRHDNKKELPTRDDIILSRTGPSPSSAGAVNLMTFLSNFQMSEKDRAPDRDEGERFAVDDDDADQDD